MRDLAARYGSDPALWRWSDAHQAVFAHPILGRLPVIGRLFTVRVAQPGGDETLFRGGLAPTGYDSVHGAEYRGVYDLATPDQSRFIAVPGQSGNPLSRHARDLLGRWLRGEGVTLGPAAAEQVLEIAPR
jgi:penicillin G amidase